MLNYTPHPINIFRREDVSYHPDLRKYIVSYEAEPFCVIPPSGKLLNASMATTEHSPIEGIPVFTSEVKSVDPTPEGWCIVSRMYAAAAPSNRLLVVHDPVYYLAEDGTTIVVGCLGLEKVSS